MFSTIASFIFGSNTNVTTTDREAKPNLTELKVQKQTNERIDAEDTIEVTSSTPSVTGTNKKIGAKNKHNRGNNKTKRNNTTVRVAKPNNGGQKELNKNNERSFLQSGSTSITQLLTPSESFDEGLDEDDWFIVEKEEEESLPRSDSEEEISVAEIKPKASVDLPFVAETTAIEAVAIITPQQQQQQQKQQQQQQHQQQFHQQQQRRRLQINSHSLHSIPRPQRHHNYLQWVRNNAASVSFNTTILNAPISATVAHNVVSIGTQQPTANNGNNTGESLVFVVTNNTRNISDFDHNNGVIENGANNILSMEESWFVTPPPCFTSIGPINMETSPFENLLIEHPSMSVYHSIRSAQEATESFVNLDLVVEEPQKPSNVDLAKNSRKKQRGKKTQNQNQNVQQRCSSAQLKHELFGYTIQKSCENKNDRQKLCRGAIKRSNKVHQNQSKANRQRRSDLQHCKVVSGANNNRKCLF